MSWCSLAATRRLILRSQSWAAPIASSGAILGKERFVFRLSSTASSSWQEVVTEAEKIVGYPTSYLSLRYLFSDEISNIALHLRKLVGSTHPILKTARKLVADSHSSINPRGLIILLMSQIAKAMVKASPEQLQEIYHKQRSLAEIAEMINTVQLIHTGMVDSSKDNGKELPSDIDFGNKISVLSGDYLLANASTELAKLRNTKVVELIAEAIQNFTKSEFLLYENGFSDQLCSGIFGWEERHYLATASLMEKSCQSVLELAEIDTQLKDCGSDFGRSIALALQVQLELDRIFNDEAAEHLKSLSAPVLFHLMDKKETDVNSLVSSYGTLLIDIKRDIQNGDAIMQSKKLGLEYVSQSQQMLNKFPKSEAWHAMDKIIAQLCHRFKS